MVGRRGGETLWGDPCGGGEPLWLKKRPEGPKQHIGLPFLGLAALVRRPETPLWWGTLLWWGNPAVVGRPRCGGET